MTENVNCRLAAALWKLYRRHEEPLPWDTGSDFPWNDPEFGRRTLAEHLDESHGAASRTSRERTLQITWLWKKLKLRAGATVFDATCGPGLYAVALAEKGCTLTGIDINPASIIHAKTLAQQRNVDANCTFIQQDIRQTAVVEAQFDAALLLYEQLAVFSRPEAQQLLANIAKALKPGGRLCVELLDQHFVDKKDSSWWFTDDTGLWGDAPFLHLGERIWDDEAEASVERYHILHLESGEMKQYTLFDQTYSTQAMVEMMEQAGFASIQTYPNWAGTPLYDAQEWVIYIAEK